MHIIRTFSENLQLRLLSHSKFNLSPSRSIWFWWVEYDADLLKSPGKSGSARPRRGMKLGNWLLATPRAITGHRLSLSAIFVFPDDPGTRDFTAWLRGWSGELFGENRNKHWLVAAESLQKTLRFQSWNLTGKLKGYLFQKTKLWEELVVLTAKFKKPRSQKKKQEVIKKMVYCVKMSILESFL